MGELKYVILVVVLACTFAVSVTGLLVSVATYNMVVREIAP